MIGIHLHVIIQVLNRIYPGCIKLVENRLKFPFATCTKTVLCVNF